MDRVFFDTDIILDFMLGREPFAQDAARLFSLAERKKINACTTGLVFSNAYYILCKFGSHRKVLDSLARLYNLVEVIGLSKTAVKQALESDFGDFEDALQNYVALTEKCKVIITRNVKDFRYSELTVMAPDEYLRRG